MIMIMTMMDHKIKMAPSVSYEWIKVDRNTYEIHIRDFRDLEYDRGRSFLTSTSGCPLSLRIYPRGKGQSNENVEHVSIMVKYQGGNTETNVVVAVIGSRNNSNSPSFSMQFSKGKEQANFIPNFAKRTDILEKDCNGEGTLTLTVSIRTVAPTARTVAPAITTSVTPAARKVTATTPASPTFPAVGSTAAGTTTTELTPTILFPHIKKPNVLTRLAREGSGTSVVTPNSSPTSNVTLSLNDGRPIQEDTGRDRGRSITLAYKINSSSEAPVPPTGVQNERHDDADDGGGGGSLSTSSLSDGGPPALQPATLENNLISNAAIEFAEEHNADILPTTTDGSATDSSTRTTATNVETETLTTTNRFAATAAAVDAQEQASSLYFKKCVEDLLKKAGTDLSLQYDQVSAANRSGLLNLVDELRKENTEIKAEKSTLMAQKEEATTNYQRLMMAQKEEATTKYKHLIGILASREEKIVNMTKAHIANVAAREKRERELQKDHAEILVEGTVAINTLQAELVEVYDQADDLAIKTKEKLQGARAEAFREHEENVRLTTELGLVQTQLTEVGTENRSLGPRVTILQAKIRTETEQFQVLQEKYDRLERVNKDTIVDHQAAERKIDARDHTIADLHAQVRILNTQLNEKEELRGRGAN